MVDYRVMVTIWGKTWVSSSTFDTMETAQKAVDDYTNKYGWRSEGKIVIAHQG